MESSACHQTPALDRDAPVPQSSSYYLPSGNSPQAYPGESRSEKLASSSISLGSTKSRRGIKARENQYKETPHRSRNVRKWALIGAGIVIVVGLIVGIVAWKVTARKNGSSSNKKLEYIEGTSKTVKSDPSNPSKFEKDSRLKPVFYGIAYTPLNAQEPSCGATLANVTEDIQLLSQLTTRIRTYDQSCNQTELILQAIQDTKVNMTVWLGASLSPTYNLTYTAHQQDLIIYALDKYGTDHVEGVTIGNDFALHTDSTAGRASLINYVVEEVNDFRTRLASKNYRKTLPVGSADDVETWGLTYSQAVDYMMVNTHAFLLITPSGRGGWTWETVMQAASPWPELVSNHPARYVTEVGWPSDSMDNVNRTQNGAVAGIAGLQTCLDSFPCQANLNGTRYFYSEAWKEELGGVEPYFGLFDHNRKLKNITLPDCAINSRQASG
ncbi:hypothetical protein JCM3765_000210 [Sporobolomyces pararoseus]